MTTLALILTLSAGGGWPTLERAFAQEPLAVIEIPDASRSLQTLERSSFRRWVPPLLGEDAEVVRGASLRLLAAWYGTMAEQTPDLLLGADAQRRADELRGIMVSWWRQLGFEPAPPSESKGWTVQTLGRAPRTVTVASHPGRGRVGWSLGSQRAPLLGQQASPSLAEDEAFRAMVAHAPRAELRGVVHVPRVFGWLLRQPGGEAAARAIGRTGIAGMQMAPFAVELVNRREARITGEARLLGDTRGAVDALGPPLPVSWPVGVPEDARVFLCASVIPAKVLRAAFYFLSAQNPLQLTLIQAQLAALEGQVGKSLDGDILGLAPKRWSVFVDGRGAPVARLELGEPLAAKALAEALFRAYPSVAPAPTRWGEVSGFRLKDRSRAAVVAFSPDAVLIARDERAIGRALAVTPPTEAQATLLNGRAVLFGEGHDVLRGLAKALRLPTSGEKSTDHSAFRVERDGERLSFLGRVRR